MYKILHERNIEAIQVFAKFNYHDSSMGKIISHLINTKSLFEMYKMFLLALICRECKGITNIQSNI